MNPMITVIESMTKFLWGDLLRIPLPGGSSIGLSLMVLLLIPAGIFYTIRTRILPLRLFPEMISVLLEKQEGKDAADPASGRLSGMQALIVSTATRVGMGNLVGVVAAISAGGAGAVFWMWVTAIIGASTAFVEATLAQLYKKKDPLYGGYWGGPAYYIHDFFAKRRVPAGERSEAEIAAQSEFRGKRNIVSQSEFRGKRNIVSILFAVSALICWGGISQVIGNSVSSAFENAFRIPPLYSTIVLVAIAAVIVLRKHATAKVLDLIVPFMAGIYFAMTVFVIVRNIGLLPSVFGRIFAEAFGLRQMVAGGFGAVLMNGVKRGLFSNEAGSGSAPCAAAAADASHPVKMGLFQAAGVFIDTLVICSCTAFLMLLAPQERLANLGGMDLLQTAMQYHFGKFGVFFIALVLWLFSFSTFLGILFYAHSNIAYLFGANWGSQFGYKIFALVMLFIGGLAQYSVVWDLGDVGIGLMTIFNLIVMYPLSKDAITALRDYEKGMKDRKKR